MSAILFLVVGVVVLLAAVALLRTRSGGRPALRPDAFVKFTLKERTAVGPDVFLFRFALDSPQQELGLPVGQHIAIRGECATADGGRQMVQHSYTPVSGNADRGHVDFVIKVYRPCAGYPAGGRLSQYLADLPLGAAVEMKGPSGRLEYLGRGRFSIASANGRERRTVQVAALAMVAGGTGITPMAQILHAIRADPGDDTAVSLVYSSHREHDILLRAELDAAAAARPGRLAVWHTLTAEAPAGWTGGRGRVDEAMLRAHLPAANTPGGVLVLACGSTAMVNQTIKPAVLALGHAPDMFFAF